MAIFEIKIKMWQLWKKYILGAFGNEKEPYHIGYCSLSEDETGLIWFSSEENIEKVETALIGFGFQPNYFSFGDLDQITSMRKMYIDPEGFWRQTHIRVHKDGEIRGHDELCYEESAIEHVNGVDCREINDIDYMSVIAALENL